VFIEHVRIGGHDGIGVGEQRTCCSDLGHDVQQHNENVTVHGMSVGKWFMMNVCCVIACCVVEEATLHIVVVHVASVH